MERRAANSPSLCLSLSRLACKIHTHAGAAVRGFDRIGHKDRPALPINAIPPETTTTIRA